MSNLRNRKTKKLFANGYLFGIIDVLYDGLGNLLLKIKYILYNLKIQKIIKCRIKFGIWKKSQLKLFA